MNVTVEFNELPGIGRPLPSDYFRNFGAILFLGFLETSRLLDLSEPTIETLF